MNRYYKAFNIAVKPYIQWDCFANSDEEYKELGLNRDDLVVSEQDIPHNKYGVCPWKIDDKGSLIARSTVEMEQFRIEFENESQTTAFKVKITEINQSTFQFNKQTCFMDETSRLIYGLLEKNLIESFELKTLEGSLLLKASDYPALILAYQTRLLNILNGK